MFLAFVRAVNGGENLKIPKKWEKSPIRAFKNTIINIYDYSRI